MHVRWSRCQAHPGQPCRRPGARAAAAFSHVHRLTYAPRLHTSTLFEHHAADAGIPFPVLQKHAEGCVTCLGAYVVVDLLERRTGDAAFARSVAAEELPGAGAENSGAKMTERRGFRFYHAVLERVGEWHGSRAGASANVEVPTDVKGGGGQRKSASSGTKRKRRQ